MPAHGNEASALVGLDIEADHCASGIDEPARQHRAHQAEADHSDGCPIRVLFLHVAMSPRLPDIGNRHREGPAP